MIVSNYSFSVYQNNRYPSFSGAKSRKLIQKLMSMLKVDKCQVTFDELEKMYNEIGYDVMLKRGSHAVIPVTDSINIPLVIPHKDKYVHKNDLKRFLLVKEGKFSEAQKI